MNKRLKHTKIRMRKYATNIVFYVIINYLTKKQGPKNESLLRILAFIVASTGDSLYKIIRRIEKYR